MDREGTSRPRKQNRSPIERKKETSLDQGKAISCSLMHGQAAFLINSSQTAHGSRAPLIMSMAKLGSYSVCVLQSYRAPHGCMGPVPANQRAT